MEYLFLMIKGFLFGIANLIPGVSGGTIAVITKVYDKLLDAVNNIFKNFKKSFIFLFIFFIGAVLAILTCSKVIKLSLAHFAIPTSCLFAGLVLGGVPSLVKPLKGKINAKNIVLLLVGLAIVIGLLFVPKGSSVGTLGTKDYILLVVCGFLATIAMVIPGISGMMIVLLLGYYEVINDTLANLTDFSMLKDNLLVLIPVGIGVILGFLTACRVIAIILKKFPIKSLFVIVGFVIGSVFAIIYNIDAEIDAIQVVFGVVMVVVGFLLTFFLEKASNRKKKEDIEEFVKEEEIITTDEK